MNSVEYVLYCRKSTDESSGQQTQSIPDQIKKCMEYAESQGLVIKEKPLDFSDFESSQDIFKEDNDKDEYTKRIFQTTRKYYIVKEQESAKEPGNRPKRKRLVSLIKQGKIKGLLSYSPDRQARNMVEGGEIIDCVDKGLIDLKYTNFHFENTASGKMMLGIWFVFSKQYSDKLSEDVSRGNKSAVARGKAMGVDKHGYYRDENGYFRPDGKNFDLMKRAFEMKIYENKSDLAIADWLNSHGFKKRSGKSLVDANFKVLFRVWIDPIYYGVNKYGNSLSDLRERNIGFEPMITEHEYKILLDRYNGNKTLLTPKEIKAEHEELIGLPRGLLKTADGAFPIFNLPNKKRFYNLLDKYKQANPDATLKDVVKPSQCRFKVIDKKSSQNGQEITFDIIENIIEESLKDISLDENHYQKFLRFMSQNLDETQEKNKIEKHKIIIQIKKIEKEKTDFIKRNLGWSKNAEEQKVYDDELKRLDQQIDLLGKEVQAISNSERNIPLEFEALVKILKNAALNYKKYTYVQKRKLASILYSNIILNNKKKLTIEVNPIFESLFIQSSRRAGNRTLNLVLKRDLL